MALGPVSVDVLAIHAAVAPPMRAHGIDLSAIVRTALGGPSVSPQALPSAIMGLCARLGEPPALSGRYGPACISDCFPT